MTDSETNIRSALAQTPHMRALLGAEFNQDWTLDWTSVDDVLKERLDKVDEVRKRAFLWETELLLGTLKSDEEVEDLLEFVGSGLVPGIDFHESPRAWLEALRDRLRSGISDLDENDG